MSDFVIRGYQPGDEYAILEMFNEVFRQNRDIAHWYWKYRDHPWGKYFISLAFASDGTLAAHYGGYPIIITHFTSLAQPREFMTLQVADKMSRAKFRNAGVRKKGILARTFFHFQEQFCKSIPFAYGFGANHSLRLGQLFFNYMNLEKVIFRRLELRPKKRLQFSKFYPRIFRINAEETNEPDARWDDFFHHVAPHYNLLVTRNAQYIQWRYIDRPDKNYLILTLRRGASILGWSVFTRNEENIEWVDALFDPNYSDYLHCFFQMLRDHPISNEARFIVCWFPARPKWWDQALDSLGFVKETEPRDLHLTGPLFSDQSYEQILRESFYYTMGDSDLF